MSRPFTGLIRGRARPRPRGGVLAAAAALLGLAACTAAGQPTLAPRATVAFESIDGLPEGLFRKLVHNLSEEAEARQLPVVTREGPAHYRVRGYAAAHVRGRRTGIAWVWDVYDAQERRALRIAGEETANGHQRDAWTAADDAMLRRIARTSMEQLAAFLTSPEVAPGTPVAAGKPPIVLVGERDSSPEAAGIFRIFRPQADPVPTVTAEAPEAADDGADSVPLPRRRPAPPAAMSAREMRVRVAASR